MGNRFGIHGLGTESIHSVRDDSVARIPEVSRPTEVTKEMKETTRSEFGSSCHDIEAVQTKFVARYNGAQNEGQETRSVFCGPENVQSEVGARYKTNVIIFWTA